MAYLLPLVLRFYAIVQRERRYEPRERARIQALERAIHRERQTKENEERDRIEMRERLEIWDDDESDEMFYVDRYVPKSSYTGPRLILALDPGGVNCVHADLKLKKRQMQSLAASKNRSRTI